MGRTWLGHPIRRTAARVLLGVMGRRPSGPPVGGSRKIVGAARSLELGGERESWRTIGGCFPMHPEPEGLTFRFVVGAGTRIQVTSQGRQLPVDGQGTSAGRAWSVPRYNVAANRLPWLIARLASSSAATSAPPIRCASTPAASSAACRSRRGSWPAQITT